MRFKRRWIASLCVMRAYLTNNRGGKQRDVHGRSYRSVYRKFGKAAMVDDVMDMNSWAVWPLLCIR